MNNTIDSIQLPPGEPGPGNEWICECPSCCREKKFYFNLEKNIGHCKVCGWVVYGAHRLGDVEQRSFQVREVTTTRCSIEGQTVNAWFNEGSRNYLIEKGVDKEQSLRLPILFEAEKKRLSVPVDPLSPEFAPSSLIRYYSYSSSKWYAREGMNKLHYVFNKKALQRKKLLVMEGIFDVLSTKMEDYAVALLGTQVSKEALISFQDKEIYIWFDWDPKLKEDDPDGGAGMIATQKLLHACNIWGLTAYDLTSIMKCDPKKMTPNLGAAQQRTLNLLKKELDND